MIPYTDHECRLKLDEIYRGDCIVLPSSYDHAISMLSVAQSYIINCQQNTVDLLKKDYNDTPRL
jgi:hypothetical protein